MFMLIDMSDAYECFAMYEGIHAFDGEAFKGLDSLTLSKCGISYARTVESTMDFDLPQEFLEWHPTCHSGAPELMELAEKFCKIILIFPLKIRLFLLLLL